MKFSAMLGAVLVSICLTAGQLLFKKAAMTVSEVSSTPAMIKQLLLNGWLIAGLFLYLLTTFAWVLLLRSAPLSVVYPFTALSFLLVPVAGHYVFGEAYSGRLLFAGLLIVAGIALVGYELK